MRDEADAPGLARPQCASSVGRGRKQSRGWTPTCPPPFAGGGTLRQRLPFRVAVGSGSAGAARAPLPLKGLTDGGG